MPAAEVLQTLHALSRDSAYQKLTQEQQKALDRLVRLADQDPGATVSLPDVQRAFGLPEAWGWTDLRGYIAHWFAPATDAGRLVLLPLVRVRARRRRG